MLGNLYFVGIFSCHVFELKTVEKTKENVPFILLTLVSSMLSVFLGYAESTFSTDKPQKIAPPLMTTICKIPSFSILHVDINKNKSEYTDRLAHNIHMYFLAERQEIKGRQSIHIH